MQTLSPELRSIYEKAHYRVELGPHSVLLSVGGVVEGDPQLLFHDPLAIITAFNPSLGATVPQLRSEAENLAANAELLEVMLNRGYEFYDAIGIDPESGEHEIGYAIFRITAGEAAAIGQQFGQAAIFLFEDGVGTVIDCANDDSVESE